METTLVLIKPDGVQRRLIGTILQRFEAKGLRLAAMKLLSVSEARARDLYSVHEGKPFHGKLLSFITGGPVVAMVWAGPQAIFVVRKLLGKTFGFEAEPGTIRGDFGISRSYNLAHGSDSRESAEREIPIFFPPDEVLAESYLDERWYFDSTEDR